MKKIMLFAILAYSIGCGDGKNPVSSTDANLEAAIRDALGKPKGELNQDDLAGLDSLDASRRNIVHLTGIESLTHLEYLFVFDNQINDLVPLAGLTQLRILELGKNQIDNVSPLASLTRLQ
ncbi:hypothetical protein HN911_03570, partial [Candidatus Bathyarchaeota archaeon]|nr:hypothetical protein [Candidatus Bathyarchaeota archaeon]